MRKGISKKEKECEMKGNERVKWGREKDEMKRRKEREWMKGNRDGEGRRKRKG